MLNCLLRSYNYAWLCKNGTRLLSKMHYHCVFVLFLFLEKNCVCVCVRACVCMCVMQVLTAIM